MTLPKYIKKLTDKFDNKRTKAKAESLTKK